MPGVHNSFLLLIAMASNLKGPTSRCAWAQLGVRGLDAFGTFFMRVEVVLAAEELRVSPFHLGGWAAPGLPRDFSSSL